LISYIKKFYKLDPVNFKTKHFFTNNSSGTNCPKINHYNLYSAVDAKANKK